MVIQSREWTLSISCITCFLFFDRLNDCILKVNDVDFTNVSSDVANQTIQGSNFLSMVSPVLV